MRRSARERNDEKAFDCFCDDDRCDSGSAGTFAPSAAAIALARKVDAHYNHLHSLTAHFTERYRGMGMDRSESGTLTLSKPGKMRWAYDAPSGKMFVLDGKFA